MKQIVFATVLGLAVASGYAQTLDTAKIDRFLDRLAEKNKGMGGLTLAKDGKVVYEHSFGYSYVNGAEKRPTTAATRYQIGSITKTYTAVMVLQLVEEGRLRLSDTLDRFFPQIPNATKITIAHILNHRAGIHGMRPDGEWGLHPRTKEEVVARIAEGQPEFEPDTKAAYSNTGYILLGQIVEKVGGKPYQDALKERITSKIGASDTYYPTIGQSDVARNEAVSYRYQDGWKQGNEVDFSILSGAGAIVATTEDLTKFIRGLFDLKLISADSLKQMLTLRDGEGMGMVPLPFAGRTMYGHTGGSATAGAWLAYDPEEKLALAYATNMKIHPVREIVGGIYDIYWHRPFEIPSFDALEVSPEILDRYVGVYSTTAAPVKFTIIRKGNTLYAQPPGESSAAPLEAVTPERFTVGPGVEFEFDAANGTMIVRRPQGERLFTKDR